MKINNHPPYNPSLKKIVIIGEVHSKNKNTKESKGSDLGYTSWSLEPFNDYKLYKEDPKIKYNAFFKNSFDYKKEHSIDYVRFEFGLDGKLYWNWPENFDMQIFRFIMLQLEINHSLIDYIVWHGKKTDEFFLLRNVIKESKHIIYSSQDGNIKVYFRKRNKLKILFFSDFVPKSGLKRKEIQAILQKLKL
jgi:hypothetical protein